MWHTWQLKHEVDGTPARRHTSLHQENRSLRKETLTLLEQINISISENFFQKSVGADSDQATNKPEAGKIKLEMDRRIGLIVASLFSCFLTTDDSDNVTFRHILNRIMILLQMQLTFVIMDKKNDGFHENHRFNNFSRDFKNISKIANAINSNIKENPNYHPFPIFGTEYYLLAIGIGREKGNNVFYQIYQCKEFEIKTNTDLAAYLLSKILDINSYNAYGDKFKEKIKQKTIEYMRINTECRQKQNGPDAINYNSSDDLDDSDESSATREIYDGFKTRLCHNRNPDLLKDIKKNGFLDRVFTKVKKNLNTIAQISSPDSDKNNNHIPANYIFFMRDWVVPNDYSRHKIGEEKRGYPYQVRIPICESQEDDIAKFFKELRKQEPDYGYSKDVEKHCKAHSNLITLAKTLDKYFWDTLRHDETYIDEFIDIIKESFGETTRSVSDLVFEHGVIHFRKPFQDGGISRSFPGIEKQKYPSSLAELEVRLNDYEIDDFNAISKDLKRLVINFYLYRGMTAHINGSRENHELGIMLVPVEVGGRILFVVGYFTSLYTGRQDPNVKESEQTTIDLKSNILSWNANYHIFSDVNSRLKKELRTNMNMFFREMLAHEYGYWTDCEHTLFAEQSSKTERLKTLENFINHRFLTLSRLFPYNQVIVKIAEGYGGPAAEEHGQAGSLVKNAIGNVIEFPKRNQNENRALVGAFLTEDFHCSVSTSNNQFFPPAPMNFKEDTNNYGGKIKDYVRVRDIEISLTSGIIRKFFGDALKNSQGRNK